MSSDNSRQKQIINQEILVNPPALAVIRRSVYADPNITAGGKVLYGILSGMSEEQRDEWISYEALAHLGCATIATTKGNLRRLASAQLILKRRHPDDPNWFKITLV